MIKIKGRLWLTREEWKRSIGPIWRGGIIGFIIGVLPGAGGTIASILRYIDREAALQASRRNSATARSKASPGRRPPTIPTPPARWCRC